MAVPFKSLISQLNINPFFYLLYDCYKHGVEDAADTCDENLCRKYVERMNNSHVFRLVGQEFDISWREWRLRMMSYADKIRYGRICVGEFLMFIGEYGRYYSVILRAGMEFYVLGVNDFAKYPVHAGLELFMYEQHFRRWKKDFTKDLKRRPVKMMEELNFLIYDRVRADVKVAANKLDGCENAMTQATYTTFLEAVWMSAMKKKMKIKPKGWEEISTSRST